MKRALGAAAAAMFVCAASAAAAQDADYSWTGYRLGLTGGYFFGQVTDVPDAAPTTTYGASGFLGGAVARLDYDFGGLVTGIGFEWTYTTVAGSYTGNPNSGSFHLDRTGTVLFRVGYGMGANLLYVQGGFNFSRVTTSGGPTGSQDTDTVTFHSGTRPGYGWHAGAGLEHAFGPRISGTIEYRYVNVGDEWIDLGPTNPGTAHFVAAAGHTLRVGVSFRFGR